MLPQFEEITVYLDGKTKTYQASAVIAFDLIGRTLLVADGGKYISHIGMPMTVVQSEEQFKAASAQKHKPE